MLHLIVQIKDSAERVAIRVSQGGHDVPTEKIKSRFPRTLANLKAAVKVLPYVYLFDNSDCARPFAQVAVFKDGEMIQGNKKKLLKTYGF